MKTAIVWRKSAYDTGKCNACRSRLMNMNNEPENVLKRWNGDRYWLICKNCGNPVAFLRNYDGTGEDGERMGLWND